MVWWAVAITIGCISAVLGSAQTSDNSIAGTPTRSHELIGDCTACHSVVAGDAMAWLAAAFTAVDPEAESARCIACHSLGRNPLAPHGLPPADLGATTAEAREKHAAATRVVPATLATTLFPVSTRFSAAIPCATCHKEHQGPDGDISGMSDGRCQACHAIRFPALSDGHPIFDDYPYNRRTRIKFDHVAHIAEHFAKPGKAVPPTTCGDCHIPDTDGRTMGLQPFWRACASCHTSEIVAGGLGGHGLVVLSVPGLDVESLLDNDIEVGVWPEYSEEEISTFMALLLAGDEESDVDFETLSELDLLDLSEAEPDDLKAVEALVWAIKKLFFELATEGVAHVADRLERATGTPLDQVARNRMLTSLPKDVIVAAQQGWLPGIEEEINARQAGEPLADPDEEREIEEAEEDDVVPAGWHRSGFAIYYLPTEHADRFLRTWLDVAASRFGTEAEDAVSSVFAMLTVDTTPGACAKCHSIDREADGSLNMKWRASRPVTNRKPVSKFRHASHFGLLTREGCITCHKFNMDAASLVSG